MTGCVTETVNGRSKSRTGVSYFVVQAQFDSLRSFMFHEISPFLPLNNFEYLRKVRVFLQIFILFSWDKFQCPVWTTPNYITYEKF